MAKHHPMDALHKHLAEAVEHSARMHTHAHDAAMAHDAQLQAERQNTVSDTLTENGG